ncbi:MAG: RNAase [Lachnospiraceae bacterium]|nr:RNAase [Lachnospiraceae bacterium]
MASSIENIKALLEDIKENNVGSDIKDPQNENMLNLAYIGDVIYDLYISDNMLRLYNGKKKINDINKMIQAFLCAKGQARFVEKLIDDDLLTDDEIEVYKHARNAKSTTKSKNSSIVDYRKATGFEALLGYLYYKKDIKRLMKILSYVEL